MHQREYNNLMEIKGIKPYEKNAKKHPKKQIRQLANIIKEVGWRQPVIVNQEGVIVVGHGRYEAYVQHAKELGLSPVWIIDDIGKTLSGKPSNIPLTPEQEKTYRLADNKLNESDWDMKLVLPELQSLSLPMVSLTGFDTDLILKPEDKDDQVPATPEKPKSKLGDIYQLGNHKVICGDSTKKEDVEKLMNEQKPDMVFTDPPYGLGGYGGRNNMDLKGDDEDVQKFYDCIPYDIEERYIWGNAYNLANLNQKPRDVIVWVKNNFGLGKGYRGQYELCFYYGKFAGSDSDVWKVDKETRYEHPTQKPVELAVRAMKNSSKVGGAVLDLFVGSGSTLIACEKTKRICYGMEIDPKYVDVIVSRYCKFVGSNKIIRNGKQEQW